MIREMKQLMKTTGKRTQFLILLFLRCPFDALFSVIQAGFLRYAFSAIEQKSHINLASICLYFVIANVCLFLYNGTIWSIYSPFITRMESSLRTKLFQQISYFSYERIESKSQGEWLTHMNTDVQLPFSQPLHLPHAVCSIVNICISSILLWHADFRTFGLVILFIIPHSIINQLFIIRTMPKYAKNSLKATADNTNDLTTLITCADVTFLYDNQKYMMDQFEKSSSSLSNANMKLHIKHIQNDAILLIFGLGGYLVLLIAGSRWIAEGRFTFADLTAVFQYRGRLLFGITMLINSLISIHVSLAGIQRLNQIMSEETEQIV